jgi:hypothetical protein
MVARSGVLSSVSQATLLGHRSNVKEMSNLMRRM